MLLPPLYATSRSRSGPAMIPRNPFPPKSLHFVGSCHNPGVNTVPRDITSEAVAAQQAVQAHEGDADERAERASPPRLVRTLARGRAIRASPSQAGGALRYQWPSAVGSAFRLPPLRRGKEVGLGQRRPRLQRAQDQAGNPEVAERASRQIARACRALKAAPNWCVTPQFSARQVEPGGTRWHALSRRRGVWYAWRLDHALRCAEGYAIRSLSKKEVPQIPCGTP